MTSATSTKLLSPISKVYTYEKPSLETFEAIAKEAMKVDHQIYSKKRLTPLNFSLNAALPSVFDVITAPYNIIKTLTIRAQEKLKAVSVSLEESHWQLAANTLHFINGALTPLSYLSLIGIYTMHLTVLTPILFIAGFFLSSVELSINAQNLYRQSKFFDKIDFSLLKKVEKLPSIKKPKEFKKAINSLISHLKPLHPHASLTTSHQNLLQDLEAIEYQPDQLQSLFPSLQKFTVEYLLDSLHENYLSINPKSQEKILSKLQKYYHKQQYPTALHSAFSLIQNVFTEKKVLLANRIQPWLALDVTKKYNPIREKLNATDKTEQEDGTKKGLELLHRITYNAELKKTVYITNIALFAITIASYFLSPFNSLVPIAFFIITMLVYGANHMAINGYLDNEKSYNFNLMNCLPAWCNSALSKIQSCFSPKAKTVPVTAVNLTQVITENRTPA